jgi:hypothetical protein
MINNKELTMKISTPSDSPSLNVNFLYNKKLPKTNFNFDRKISVREMIRIFLESTNSIITFDSKKIMFFHGTNLLNLPKFIDQRIENVLGRQKSITIQIKDKGNIIGGLIIYA